MIEMTRVSILITRWYIFDAVYPDQLPRQTISNFFLSRNERTSKNVRFVVCPISIHTCVRSSRYLWFWRKKMISKERKGYEEGDRENVSNWMNIHVHPFFHLHTSVPWYSKLDINEYLCSEKVRIIRKEIERKKERKDEGEIWRIVSKLNEHPSTCTSSSTGE